MPDSDRVALTLGVPHPWDKGAGSDFSFLCP